MGKLASISITPEIESYAQGAAQDSVAPVADFIAPTVEVPSASCKYKIYSSKNRFRLPQTLRGMGGRAATIEFDRTDGSVDCEPHALDAPLDYAEIAEMRPEDVSGVSDEVAEIGALVHEKDVIDKAVAAAGAGTTLALGSSDTPIDAMDQVIMALIKAAMYGSAMGIRVIFGADFWRQLKNNTNIRGHFVVGNAKAGGIQLPTVESFGQLLIGNPQVKTSFMVYDDAAEGIAADIKFLLDKSALFFACKDSPTRRDPSFMKTFRLRNQWMVPRVYDRDDGRVKVFGYDWSCKVQVTNSAAVTRLNVA